MSPHDIVQDFAATGEGGAQLKRLGLHLLSAWRSWGWLFPNLRVLIGLSLGVLVTWCRPALSPRDTQYVVKWDFCH